jgi:hypothetical protein
VSEDEALISHCLALKRCAGWEGRVEDESRARRPAIRFEKFAFGGKVEWYFYA